MNNLFILHLKMVFSRKLTIIILTLSSALMLIILGQLTMNAETKSSIPIGITNLDDSETADNLVQSLKKVPALSVYENTEEKLKNLLKEEQIAVYFVIGKGYEQAVEGGKTDGLITMYYTKGDEKYKILSDIIAGEMLYPISLNKGYRLYESLNWKGLSENDNNRLTKEEYVEYADSLTAKADYNFAFDITLMNTKSGEAKEVVLANSIIYQQTIIGIIGMLYSFIAMFIIAAFVMERENAIHKRLKIALLTPVSRDFYQVGAVILVEGILSLFLLIILGSKLGESLLLKLSAILVLMFLYSLVMAALYLFLSKIVNRVEKFQLAGTGIVLLFGAAGFLHLLSGFINPNILNISKIIPNNWFITGFTDIILSKSLQDIPYKSFACFILAALGLSLINGLIGLKQKQ